MGNKQHFQNVVGQLRIYSEKQSLGHLGKIPGYFDMTSLGRMYHKAKDEK